jgi:hypothetical protein
VRRKQARELRPLFSNFPKRFWKFFRQTAHVGGRFNGKLYKLLAGHPFLVARPLFIRTTTTNLFYKFLNVSLRLSLQRSHGLRVWVFGISKVIRSKDRTPIRDAFVFVLEVDFDGGDYCCSFGRFFTVVHWLRL